MMICIPEVMNKDDTAKVLAGISAGQFDDGRLSAGEVAGGVKNNLEYRRPDNKPTEYDHMVIGALSRCEAFRDFALPKHIAPPIFSRYDPGMTYGEHVDAPIMGNQSPMRSDLSLTLFLSEPGSYDGGELVMETGFGRQAVKLPAGDAVVYSSSTLHHVTPVTSGARYVALSWVQSLVRDEAVRYVLNDLSDSARILSDPSLTGNSAEIGKARNKVLNAYSNLVRREADM